MQAAEGEDFWKTTRGVDVFVFCNASSSFGCSSDLIWVPYNKLNVKFFNASDYLILKNNTMHSILALEIADTLLRRSRNRSLHIALM